MKTVPYGKQFINAQDIKFVSKALKEDLITTGNYVKKFEKNISKFLNVKYVSSCSNGTSALHLAFMAIELKKDDVIILGESSPKYGDIALKIYSKIIKNNPLKKIMFFLNNNLLHPKIN